MTTEELKEMAERLVKRYKHHDNTKTSLFLKKHGVSTIWECEFMYQPERGECWLTNYGKFLVLVNHAFTRKELWQMKNVNREMFNLVLDVYDV